MIQKWTLKIMEDELDFKFNTFILSTNRRMWFGLIFFNLAILLGSATELLWDLNSLTTYAIAFIIVQTFSLIMLLGTIRIG